jgi:uncharacterized protein
VSRVFGKAVLIALTALAAGCASSPPARFYTLATAVMPVAAPSMLSVAVGPVSIPAVVDRPEIVLRTGPHEVRLDELNRWAAPLHDEVARVVAGNLVALLGTPRVTLLSQTSSADAEYRVAIEVRTFESAPGWAALDAVWIVQRMKDGKSQAGRTSVRETVQDDTYDALAAAHSRSAATMSGNIADAIRALQGE